MKKLILGLAAGIALFAGPVAAEGLLDRHAVRAPACCETASWSGFYVGAGIGGGAVNHELTFGIPGVFDIINLDGIGGEGFFGTVSVGYDRQINDRFVVGVFADYDFSDISTDLSLLGGLFTASLDHDRSWSIGARAGFLSSPTTLWYGTVGYTEAEFSADSSIGSLDLPDFKGYFVGAGVESMLGRGWSLKGEYRFTQFDEETILSLGPFDLDLDTSMHTVRFSLNYKFGRREEAHHHTPLK
jgi:outer membrane immunogenic protein